MCDSDEWIKILGARTHNLQALSVFLPRNRLTVITGPSGSGKSSLAFDTLYAEGRRRYLETLRGDQRALFHQLQPPDVDAIEGLPPVVCVSQRTAQARPRSTLATVTEIHDHLRLLWARFGNPHCPDCKLPIRKHTLTEIVRATLAQEGRKIFVLAPLVQDQPGEHREHFQYIRQTGFLRARVDGVLMEIRDTPRIEPRKPHTIELIVDRLIVKTTIEERLRESLAAASQHGHGRIVISDIETGDWNDDVYSTTFACMRCQATVPDLEPRGFSFNNPHGACPRCTGLGLIAETGATPNDLETEDDEVEATGPGVVCPECGGARLNRAARAVRFVDRGLHEVTALSVDAAADFFGRLTDVHAHKAQSLLVSEMLRRLQFLQQVGLGYLTLDRPAQTLSGGEAQRARLATHLGGGLLGVCYILDEPTLGLHPRDTQRLIDALRGLQARGNTVVVVEHDESVMRQADWLIDIGPGAGKHGGRLMASGPPGPSPSASEGRDGRQSQEALRWRSGPDARCIALHAARHHNLKNIDVAFPLGCFTCLTGVSGSGKSSLARDILIRAARRHLGLVAPAPGAHDRIDGLEQIDKVLEVDQRPLGKSSRSNPASHVGLFDPIRTLFAATRLAKIRGYKANRFSFNVKGGRCEVCQGHGTQRVDEAFLPDLRIPCPGCQGKRFNAPTLEVRYRGLSIADVLDMPIEDARAFFVNVPMLQGGLQALDEVGLGYLALGQPGNTLSGGEAQRVKLAAELAKAATGKTLYLFDEPTAGLHGTDIARLLRVFRRLTDAGNTVLVIEHHLGVIAACDWVIDLGPDAGDAGGEVVVAGPPSALAACDRSITGRYLARPLDV
ncbi:MAG: ATP-binding cassette domain-containing protein [Planctomycetes bacterium]|nr:ATP-binding cassette domain-containing protein [Planctomycetota bacterium]